MASPPQVHIIGLEQSSSHNHNNNPSNSSPTRPSLQTRKSSSLHRNVITKLRPLPFQYVWAVWHDRSGSMPTTTTNTSSKTGSITSPRSPPSPSSPSTTTSTYDDRLTVLADSVPDIAAFYRIYNNFPWDMVKHKDSVHVFRQGVKPLWEDPENLEGGGWVLKVKKDEDKAVKAWEEICLMGCGGELQAAVEGEHDHILGLSYSPRLYWVHITIWNKQGSNTTSTRLLQDTVLDRLSPHLRPQSQRDYYYKKHSDHEGWKEAVGDVDKIVVGKST